MAVRTHVAWPWRAVVVLALVATVAGMWWWGFDFGQIFGGFNRKEVDSKLAKLEAESGQLHRETTQLRARNNSLESELAIAQGAQATLSKQATELQNENSQLKEELEFLQKLLADSNKQTELTIQRLAAERERDDLIHFSMLVVRGGNPAADFAGNLTLQATLIDPASGTSGHLVSVALPDEQPETGTALKLKFKYYQRVEGFFHAPPGCQLRSLIARVYETGQNNPRATRSLNLP